MASVIYTSSSQAHKRYVDSLSSIIIFHLRFIAFDHPIDFSPVSSKYGGVFNVVYIVECYADCFLSNIECTNVDVIVVSPGRGRQWVEREHGERAGGAGADVAGRQRGRGGRGRGRGGRRRRAARRQAASALCRARAAQTREAAG